MLIAIMGVLVRAKEASAESFLYGAYAGLVLTPIHNALWRRWVREEQA